MGWQDAVAIAVVFGAAFYLSSLAWKGLIGGKAPGCGSSCGKCSSDAGASTGVNNGAVGTMVSIGLPTARVAPAKPEPADAP